MDKPVLDNFEADRIDVEDLYRCVHCGLCLNECPTYLEWGLETESPRGRLALMKAVAEGRVGYSKRLVEHMDLCLLCRACEAACPSGVPFGKLMVDTRVRIQEETNIPLAEAIIRNFIFRHVLPNKSVLATAFKFLRFYQASGFQSIVKRLGILSFLPSKIAQMENMLPKLRSATYPSSGLTSVPGEGSIRAKVSLFSGCIMPLVFGSVNKATVNVLSRNGCDVAIPQNQGCCGALNVHSGENKTAQRMARRNIDAFDLDSTDAIVINSAGCGAMLKEYQELLKHDDLYRERAGAFSAKVKDVSEFLVALPIIPPSVPINKKVTYQDSCHLAHAQGIKNQPRKLLDSIPGLELVEMASSDRCCGAAGIYNILQREASKQMLDSKMEDVNATNAELVATANPGCMLQLDLGLMEAGRSDRSYHVVELLDKAYKSPE